MQSIYCLFAESDHPEEPSQVLAAWWHKQPTFKQFCEVFGLDIPERTNVYTIIDEYGKFLLNLRFLYNGQRRTVYGKAYRLKEIPEGLLANIDDLPF